MIQEIGSMKLIGLPNLASMLDENQSLTSAWNKLTTSGASAQLDALADAQKVARNRTTLVVFSPYTFVAWAGALLPANTQVPEGLNAFDLPKSQVAVLEQKASMQLPLPLNHLIASSLAKFEKSGVQLPEHLGQTDKPYFLESYLMDEAGEVTGVTQQVYLGVSIDNEDETYLD